jgi:hypothetical protein
MSVELEIYNDYINNGYNSHKKVIDEPTANDHICHPYTYWHEYDINGIYLCKVCEKCADYKLSGFNSDILR